MFIGLNSVVAPFSVSAVDDQGFLGALSLSTIPGGVENTSQAVHQLCDHISYDVTDIRAISVLKGPGPYTSLRLGVSSMMSLSQLLACPIYGCHTLEMIVSQYHDEQVFFTMIPARYHELNVALFSQTGTGVDRLTDDFQWSYELAIQKLSAIQQPVAIVGSVPDDFLSLCREQGLTSRFSFRLEGVSSESVAYHARDAFLLGQEGSFLALNPVYSHSPVIGVSSRRHKQTVPKDHRT